MDVRARATRSGFSLLELTLVLAIIGVLMAVATINLMGGAKRANIKATQATLRVVGDAIKQFALNSQSTLPADLKALVTSDYVEDGSLDDAWGQALYYRAAKTADGKDFQLLSGGPDKTVGTEDDINYWTIATKK
ncbi:MAG: type II secretion system protein GspG [Phycisphaeraceae bacterium]|nr:type II secretion system protein GspG [Phycisphaeraceae bacterium]